MGLEFSTTAHSNFIIRLDLLFRGEITFCALGSLSNGAHFSILSRVTERKFHINYLITFFYPLPMLLSPPFLFVLLRLLSVKRLSSSVLLYQRAFYGVNIHRGRNEGTFNGTSVFLSAHFAHLKSIIEAAANYYNGIFLCHVLKEEKRRDLKVAGKVGGQAMFKMKSGSITFHLDKWRLNFINVEEANRRLGR